MTEPDAKPHEASWAFALEIYAKPGVAEACLRLQSEASADVMILLLCAFAAARCGRILTHSDLLEIEAFCAPWREQVVRPLRAMRTTLKGEWPPMAGTDVEQLRSQIKTSELAAERLQSDLLSDWLHSKAPAPSPVTPDGLRAVLCDAVAMALGDARRDRMDGLLPAIDRIAAAAFLP